MGANVLHPLRRPVSFCQPSTALPYVLYQYSMVNDQQGGMTPMLPYQSIVTNTGQVENSNFFREVPKILNRFSGRFSYCVGGLLLIFVCAFAVPYQWRIRQFAAIFPLALSVGNHFLLPIALNPALMRLTW